MCLRVGWVGGRVEGRIARLAAVVRGNAAWRARRWGVWVGGVRIAHVRMWYLFIGVAGRMGGRVGWYGLGGLAGG